MILGGLEYRSIATVAKRALLSKFADVLNVKDARFGAKGDGIADDTVAIQAALTAAERMVDAGAYGVRVYLPRGNYKISAGLSWKRDGIWLAGDGAASRIFSATTGITFVTIGYTDDSTDTKFDAVMNLQLESTSPNNADVTGIKAQRNNHSWFQNLVLTGFYKSMDLYACNRLDISGVRWRQDGRTVTLADSCIRHCGTVGGGHGGGIHVRGCELSPDSALNPRVNAAFYIEEADGFYVDQCHTKGCNYGFYFNPTGAAGKNYITDVLVSNSYVDDNYGDCVRLDGTVNTGGLYQSIKFQNCYFRGTGAASSRCLFVTITDGTFLASGARVKNLSFIGCSFRQANVQGVLIQGVSTVRIPPRGVIFSGCYFADNNQGGGATGAAITAHVTDIVVTGCVFDPDNAAAPNCVQVVLDTGVPDGKPGFICNGNNFKNSNCTAEPITYTTGQNLEVDIHDNMYPGVGQTIDQALKKTTTDATVTVLWTKSFSANQSGIFKAEVHGCDGTSAQYAMYEVSAAVFRTGAGALTMVAGSPAAARSDKTAGMPVGAVAFALNANALELRVTGIAATTITWNGKVHGVMAR